MRLLVATHNQGKAKEIAQYLENFGIEVVTPEQVGIGDFEPVETGDTFLANAELKAMAYGDQARILTLADDSGLEVAALNGQPGVHSKRFFAGTDVDRNQHLLKLLADKENRTARFVSVLVLYDPSSNSRHAFTGVVEGRITTSTAGDQGFGYDPLFIATGFEQTFAQLGIEIKNQISHRARALQQLQTHFKQEMNHG